MVLAKSTNLVIPSKQQEWHILTRQSKQTVLISIESDPLPSLSDIFCTKWLTISSGCPIEISTAANDVIFSKWKLNVHLNWISVCTPSTVIHTIITFWSFALRFPTRYYAYGGALNYWREIQVFVEKIKTYFLWCYIYIQELDLSLSFPFLHCRFCLLLILNCLSIRMRAIPTIKANVDYLNLLPEILFPNTNWSSGFQLKLNHTPYPPKKLPKWLIKHVDIQVLF